MYSCCSSLTSFGKEGTKRRQTVVSPISSVFVRKQKLSVSKGKGSTAQQCHVVVLLWKCFLAFF